MRLSSLLFAVSVLLLILAIGLPTAQAQIRDLNDRGVFPDSRISIGLPDDEDEDEDEDGDCLISRAVAEFDAVLPTLTLEGRFCDDPVVLLGRDGGDLEPLLVLSASDSFVTVDLGSITPGTSLAVVQCPCATCQMDVFLGTTGPVGPTGAAGPSGATGPTGPDDPDLEDVKVGLCDLYELHELPLPEFCPLPPKVVFISQAHINGSVGVSTATALCNQEAQAAGLSASPYRAWLSTTSHPPAILFVHHPGPYVLPDGTKVADSWADLTDGTLDAPINRTAFGGLVGGSDGVHTGTNADGTAHDHNCNNYTTSVSTGRTGHSSAQDAKWTSNGNAVCSTAFRFYCFGQ